MGTQTPYITPDILMNAPTGIDWSTIPAPGATQSQLSAELINICGRATAKADGFLNLTLRATLNAEQIVGPGARYTINNSTGVTRLLLRNIPVIDVVFCQQSPNWPPFQWQTIDTTYLAVEDPLTGQYGTVSPPASGGSPSPFVVMAGFLFPSITRNSNIIKIQYLNGFPHCGLTAEAAAGDTTLQVDDVTGWVNSLGDCAGKLFDGADSEICSVTSVTANAPVTLPDNETTVNVGPGTLMLSSPLVNSHPAGLIFTTMPDTVQDACINWASAEALMRGATTISIPGGEAGAGSTPTADALINMAEEAIRTFARII